MKINNSTKYQQNEKLPLASNHLKKKNPKHDMSYPDPSLRHWDSHKTVAGINWIKWDPNTPTLIVEFVKKGNTRLKIKCVAIFWHCSCCHAPNNKSVNFSWWFNIITFF